MKRFIYAALVAGALMPGMAFAVPMDNAPTYQNKNLTGNDIMSIQQSLIGQGYLQGTASGTWDAKTSSALRSYQLKNHLAASRSLDANTVNRLGVHIGSNVAPNTGTSASANMGANAYDNNGANKTSPTGPNSTNPSSPANDYGTSATMNSSSPSAGSVGTSGSMGTTSGGGSSSGASAGGGGASSGSSH